MSKILILILGLVFIGNIHSEEIKTTSPDNSIVISFKLSENGEPLYSINYNGVQFLNWSKLGLNFKGSGMLASDLKLVTIARNTVDETYRVYSGKSKYSRNYCNETLISLEEKKSPARKIDIYFRAFNDGAAFRYGIPEQQNINSFEISTEETYFNFEGDYQCWAMKKNSFRHSYEGEYKPYKLSAINNTPGDTTSNFPYITLPLTFKMSDNLFVSLSEANITNYPGTVLLKSDGNTLKSKLSPEIANNDISVRGETPAVSPWRLFIIGSRPGKLIESNLVMNLNEPCKIDDASDWIKPGKSTWSWWAEDRGFDPNFGYQILSTKTVKYYVDFASSNSLQYVILDGGWYGWFDASKDDAVHDLTKTLPELNLPEAAAYANSKGIGLILWVVWYEIERQMTQALDYFQSLGIKGLKIDFMDRDDQYMTDFYRKIAEECAARKMVIDFHGAYKPDGLSRTYPNILTYEGVLGNEYARWDKLFPNPQHNVTIPFTRMVAGPMDYTPGSMVNSTKENYIGQWKYPMTMGTRSQQLAMTVVYESGLVTLCDSPKLYEALPEFEFLKKVPAAWDSTIVLDGKIGEYIIIARKKDKDWFIGAMTNQNSRDINIDLSFLENSNYEAYIYSDAPDADLKPSNVKISKQVLNKGDSMNIRLAKGGGLAVFLKKKSG
ncbi:MAG: glycoside hydrolase family 97 protein [Ignavibacteria bacterium]